MSEAPSSVVFLANPLRAAGFVIGGAVGAGLLAALLHSLRLPSVVRVARRRLESYEAATVTLSHGAMAYVDRGCGETILSLHGLYGGYDQGFDNVANLAATHRVIAPSRFGYPGSDVRGAGTPREQAAALVELLDRLGVDQVFALGASAGGTAAIRLALDHPERVKGVILYSSAAPWGSRPESPPSRLGPPPAMNRDWVMWLLSPFFPVAMSMPSNVVDTMLPMSQRRVGAGLDAAVCNPDMAVRFDEYSIENLRPPVLLLHARDDRVARFAPPKGQVRASLHRYPRLTAKIFNDGGHLLRGHAHEVEAAVTQFIATNAA